MAERLSINQAETSTYTWPRDFVNCAESVTVQDIFYEQACEPKVDILNCTERLNARLVGEIRPWSCEEWMGCEYVNMDVAPDFFRSFVKE